MKLEIHEIRYFLALSTELHFGRAALASHVSQPALTRAIRSLENKLGGLLFHRQPNRIMLTELGRSVEPRLRAAYQELQAVVQDASEQVATSAMQLRVGAMCTAGPRGILALIDGLRKSIPNLQILLQEARADHVIELLLRGEVDVAVAAWPHYPPEVEPVVVLRERYAIAFQTGHIFGALQQVPLEQLAGENYLERLNCEFDDHFAAQAGEWNVDIATCFKSEREDWIQAMIAAGEGVAIVPEFMAMPPGIEVRPLCEPELYRDISVLTVRARRSGAAADAFVHLARARVWGR